MSFSIDLQPELVRDDSGSSLYAGHIALGDFEEDFLACSTSWAVSDYQCHWRRSLEAAVAGRPRSCLITSFHDPVDSGHLCWWPMYRVGDHVAFQNHLLFFRDLRVPFDVNHPEASVPPRMIQNEEGQQLSEWLVPVRDLSAFLATAFLE